MRKLPAKNSKKSEFNAKAASKNEAACFLFQNTRKLLIYGRRSIIIILVNVSHHWNPTSTFLFALSSERIVSNILYMVIERLSSLKPAEMGAFLINFIFKEE